MQRQDTNRTPLIAEENPEGTSKEGGSVDLRAARSDQTASIHSAPEQAGMSSVQPPPDANRNGDSPQVQSQVQSRVQLLVELLEASSCDLAALYEATGIPLATLEDEAINLYHSGLIDIEDLSVSRPRLKVRLTGRGRRAADPGPTGDPTGDPTGGPDGPGADGYDGCVGGVRP